MKLRNDGSLDDFRQNVRKLLCILVAGKASEHKGQECARHQYL
jgi:hypothetical protein